MKVTQEPIKLKQVLTDQNFIVPLYQREYAWDLEQVSDLYYDIESMAVNEGHFLGSLLLYREDAEKNIMEVIDGQQRLTTLFLLLHSVKKYLKDSGNAKAIDAVDDLIYKRDDTLLDVEEGDEPRLGTGKRDRKLFKAILQGEDSSTHKDGRRKSHKYLLSALEFFDEKVGGIKTDKGFEGLIKFTEKIIRSEFIVMTAEQSSDKILLFKTLNARGIELSKSDLIKNEVCHRAVGISEEDAVDLWDEMRENIEDCKASIDVFLFHYINSLSDSQQLRKDIDAKRNIIRKGDSYPPVPEKYIFDVYDEKLKQTKKTKQFLADILDASDKYKSFVNPPADKLGLNGLKAMGINKCFPLLLKAKTVLNAKSFDKLVHAIECISFRHSILRNDPKDLERLYYILASKLNSDTDLADVIKEISQHSSMKSEEKFKNEFIWATPKQSISKMILSRIIRKHNESVDWNNRDVHIEHIMPKTPKGEWDTLFKSDEDDYKDNLIRTGNLTVLQDKKNIKAKNHDFIEKKKYYNESRLKITKDITNYKKWDYDSITQRQTELYEEATDIWSIK